MSNNTYCKRIFEPNYIYRCAARQTGEHYELKGMLEMISGDFLSEYNAETEKSYNSKSFYYNYKRYILVLTFTDNTFVGQTFINGAADIYFDLLNEETKAKAFFQIAKEQLTVIDFFTGKQIKPSYKDVLGYAKSVIKTNSELDSHRQTIEQFNERFKKLREDTELLYSTSPSTSYKKAMNLLMSLTKVSEEIFSQTFEENIEEIDSFCHFNRGMEGYMSILGLYIYVLKYGIEHRRFLKRSSNSISLCFNQTINQMRKFVAENEGIVDKYIDYMRLTANDRENLMFLLSQEQIMTNGGKNIGDDLFC